MRANGKGKPARPDTRTRAIDAARLLNQILVDVITGTRSLEIFESLSTKFPLLPDVYRGMRRMCLSHVLLGLSKFAEFYDAYADVLPADCCDPSKGVMKMIEAKQIRQFRNKFVAHIMDDDTGRPLAVDALTRYVESIFSPDEAGFVAWINDQNNAFPSTVVSIVERTRNELIKAHSITSAEMNPLGQP